MSEPAAEPRKRRPRRDPEPPPVVRPPPLTAAALSSRLAPLGQVARPRALSVNYRVLEFTPDYVGACSPWGAIQARAALGLDGTICVDATNFLAQVKGVVEEAPFVMQIASQALHWECGAARGSLPALDATVEAPVDGKATTRLPAGFGDGLELGALACVASALTRSAELEGVQIYNRNGKAYAAASDSTMVSACCLGEALPLADGAVVTLKPEAAALLAEITQRRGGGALSNRHDPGANREAEQQELIERLPADLQAKVAKGMSLSTALKLAEDAAPPTVLIGMDDTSVYCTTPDTTLHLYQLTPLGHDLAEKLEPFRNRKLVMPLWRETIAAFLKRAEGLAEVRAETLVEMAVTDGTLIFTFREEAMGETQENYRVEGGPKLTVPAIRVEARRLARALAHADELVFDYADEHVLILRGPDEFLFGIAGRR